MRIESLVPPPAEADAAVLAAVIRDSRADTGVPEPGWIEYLAVVLRALAEWIWDRGQPLGSLFGLGRGTAVVVASVFVGVVLLARRRRRRSA